MIRTLLAAAICLSMGAANAGNVNPLLRKDDVCGRFEVFHINGIMTSRPGAQENLALIKVVYGNAYKEHILYYGLAYNQTRSFTSDFYDSALQVISGYAGATWDAFMNAVTFGIYSTFMPDATAKAIAKKVTDFYAFTKPAPYQDQDLADIMLELSGQSRPHARVVFVPHSQGNLYMNLVYDRWVASGKAAKSIGVVGVAVPYSSVRSGNTYITSSNDVVIDAVRKATLGTVLAPNATITLDATRDRLGHSFNTYLTNTTVKAALFSHITNEFNGLRTTSPDPPRWLIAQSHGKVCGSAPYPVGYPGPYSCWLDVPTGAPYQEHKNVSVNFFSNPSIGPQQHEYGTAADLDPLTRHFMATCYSWYLSDRKAQILKYNFILDSGYYWPSNTHPGSCGRGFPWQTPYGNPDAAWMIYSADSSRITSKTWAADAVWYYNDVEKLGVCKR